jgi:CBS-domain-containing membrane protein
MKITQFLTPITKVQWLSATDTVGDAFDHMETYEVTAAPVLDWDGRYLGTVTEADLRRHVERWVDRARALHTPLADVERRSTNPAVAVESDVSSMIAEASAHPFVPVVDASGKLVGIVDPRRIVDAPLPRAA